MGINLQHYELGAGVVSVQITDLERKLNINRLAALGPAQAGGQDLLQRALMVLGVEATDTAVIVDSIRDWRDPDDHTGLSGAESDFYLAREHPHFAKNGPIDDLAELLLINGITPEIYWGPRWGAHQRQFIPTRSARRSPRDGLQATYSVGLVDLFTALSSGAVNINTAPIPVLQAALGVTDDIAADIIRFRAGLDGVEGTDDDTPFQNTSMVAVPGMEAQPPNARAPLTVISSHFEVVVDVRLGRSHRQCVAILGRGLPGAPAALAGEGNVKVLQFSWR
jgi:type II secretory pathway component PulK